MTRSTSLRVIGEACATVLFCAAIVFGISITCAAVESPEAKPSLRAKAGRSGDAPAAPEGPKANDSPEVTALRDELATIREYDQRLLNTVLWSLSGVFLLVILLGSYSWFTNFRIYSRDLESLRLQVRVDAERESALLRSASLQHEQALTGKSAEQIDQFREDISKRMEAFKELLAAETRIREESTKELKSFSESVADSKSSAVRYSLNMLRYEVSILARRLYESGTNTYLLLQNLVGHLEVLHDLGWISQSGHAGMTLREIVQCMRKPGASISDESIRTLLGLLEKMPPHLNTEVDTIKSLLEKIAHT